MTLRFVRFFFALLTPLTLATLVACGGSSSSGVGSGTSSTEPTTDLTGKWSGRVVSQTGFAATFTSDLVQTGSSVSGSTKSSGGCIGGGKLAGTISGDNVSVSVTAGDVRVDLKLTVSSPDQVDGTYDIAPAGGCPADRGSVSMSRTR
jgi:hypothetical protein